MAGAYHWEARRRQMVMDRRLKLMQARGPSEGVQRMEVPKEQPPSQMALNPPPSHEVKEDLCPCNTDHVLKHSGKLLKRYTTTEYIQQW